MICWAMVFSFALNIDLPSRIPVTAVIQEPASTADMTVTSMIFLPSIFTANDSGFSLLPSQARQGDADIYFSISARLFSDSVSL